MSLPGRGHTFRPDARLSQRSGQLSTQDPLRIVVFQNTSPSQRGLPAHRSGRISPFVLEAFSQLSVFHFFDLRLAAFERQKPTPSKRWQLL